MKLLKNILFGYFSTPHIDPPFSFIKADFISVPYCQNKTAFGFVCIGAIELLNLLALAINLLLAIDLPLLSAILFPRLKKITRVEDIMTKTKEAAYSF